MSSADETRFSHLIDPFRPAKGAPPKTLVPFIRWLLSGAWPVLIVAAAVSAFAGIAETTGPAWVIGRVIDGVTQRGADQLFSRENIFLYVLALAFFLGIRPLAFGASNYMTSAVVAPAIGPMAMARLNRWMLAQSVDYYDDDFAGRLAQKQAQTANALTESTVEVINAVVFALASLAGAVVLISGISTALLPVFVLWLIAYGFILRWYLPRIRNRARARAAARARVTGQVVDTITNIRTVKLFAQHAREDDAAIDEITALRDRGYDFGRMAAGFRVSLMLLAGVLPLVLVGGAILVWSRGAATTGEIAAAGLVSIRLAQMTGFVSFSLMNIYRDLGEIEDGMRTLTPDRRLLDAPDARPLAITGGGITFDHVSFAYGREPGAGAGVQDIELVVKPGEKLALVGPSGAGKSTILTLLLRLHDPESGRILIDGQDIAHVTQESLRQAIGMVTQETAMFNRSARENILYGWPEASENDLLLAAQRAEADTFIRDLEDVEGRRGYEAHLGERGVKLSGGQRQRIAIARVMLKDAPILVLDEATSALDSEVEAAIQETLVGMMDNKTVIAIAHRLSTIAHMDRIVVLAQGRIAEQGSHAELLERGGIYAGLWNRQSGGFLGEA